MTAIGRGQRFGNTGCMRADETSDCDWSLSDEPRKVDKMAKTTRELSERL